MEKEKIVKFIKNLIKGQSASALIMTDSDEIAGLFGYKKKYLVYGSLQDTPDFDL